MTPPKKAILVRFKPLLPFEEVMSIVETRAGEFRALPGLQQKYYLRDPATGEIGGLYLWDSQESLDAYRESDLRASIAEAYHAESAPRVDVFDVVKTLRSDAE